MVGLGFGDELVNDTRLGEIGITSGNGCTVFARDFDEEGEVGVGELPESCQDVCRCGMHFCGEGAAMDVGEE